MYTYYECDFVYAPPTYLIYEFFLWKYLSIISSSDNANQLGAAQASYIAYISKSTSSSRSRNSFCM